MFLTYARVDAGDPILKRLSDDLMQRHPDVGLWFDSNGYAGESLRDPVTAYGLDKADYIVHLVSERSAGERDTRRAFEIAYARQQRERAPRIVPVFVGPSVAPSAPDGIEYVDLSQDYEHGYARLVELLGFGYSRPVSLLDTEQLRIDSEVIEVCRYFDRRLLRALLAKPNELSSLSPRAFEKLVAEVFDGLGYAVELTKRTRDGGRDIVAVKNAEIDLRILIECKTTETRKAIGVRPVRELFGVLRDEGANKGILATTAYFSPDARLFFDRHRWELEGRDREGLLDWLRMYEESRQARA